jgi:conserved oligomeric Golgi complex subunit 1
MASTGLDAKDLKSWQEAFNYPVAATRQIEKQLRNDIEANKERLRTLVGWVDSFPLE